MRRVDIEWILRKARKGEKRGSFLSRLKQRVVLEYSLYFPLTRIHVRAFLPTPYCPLPPPCGLLPFSSALEDR